MVVAAAAVVLVMNQNGNPGPDPQKGDDVLLETTIPVYLQTSSGIKEYTAKVGVTYYEALSAIPGISFDKTNNVQSVSGYNLSAGHAWTIWNHSTLMGLSQWNQSSASRSDVTSLGTRLVVMDSTVTEDEYGIKTYSQPTVEVTYKVYFFIQFREQYDANDQIKNFKTEKERKSGFWVVGTGKTAVDALKDASKNYGMGTVQYSSGAGVTSFFGLGDENVNGAWRYWVQYNYTDGKWGYNTLYLDAIDLNDMVFFGLVRQTTSGMDDIGYVPTSTPADLKKKA